ncbi:MAG: hypothetical protein WC644_12530 [Ignavibacteria bacterium]
MKNIRIIVLILLSLTSCISNAQIKMLFESEKNEKEKIAGYINSGFSDIQIFRIDISDSEDENDTSLVYKISISNDKSLVTEFDAVTEYTTLVNYDGNILYREITDKNGQLAGKTLYTYNDKGFISKRELYFGNVKAIDEVYEFGNYESGEVNNFSADGTLMNKSLFKLNSQKKLIEELKYNSKGEVEQKYEYTYDSEGRMIEDRIILINEQKTITNYSYDENSNVIEEQTKDNSGNILSYNKFAYEGNKIIEELRDSKDIKLRKFYTYKNGMLQSIKFEDLIENSIYIWEYRYK